jgi:hypothetical protein
LAWLGAVHDGVFSDLLLLHHMRIYLINKNTNLRQIIMAMKSVASIYI